MVALTLAGTVAAFNYVDDKTDNALSSYAKHRFESAADYVVNGAWKKIFEKASVKLKGKKIKNDPNLQFIDEILEKTKLQTDENLTDLWAALLANSMQGSISVRREYFEVLEKLNPYDVMILNIAMDSNYSLFVISLENRHLSEGNTFDANVEMAGFLKKNYNVPNFDIEMGVSTKYLQDIGLITPSHEAPFWNLTLFGLGLAKALEVQ